MNILRLMFGDFHHYMLFNYQCFTWTNHILLWIYYRLCYVIFFESYYLPFFFSWSKYNIVYKVNIQLLSYNSFYFSTNLFLNFSSLILQADDVKFCSPFSHTPYKHWHGTLFFFLDAPTARYGSLIYYLLFHTCIKKKFILKLGLLNVTKLKMREWNILLE